MSKPLGVGLSAQNLYATLTLQALAALLPLSLLVEGGTLIEGTKATIAEVGGGRFFGLLLMTGVSHYLYNECAFIALSSVHPVTHAVANTIKRVAVIVISVLYFRNPLTLTGATGSTIAIIGPRGRLILFFRRLLGTGVDRHDCALGWLLNQFVFAYSMPR